MDTSFTLDGRVAFVTGGSRGLGREISLALARAGAHVVVVSRHLADVERVAQEIEQLGVKSLALKADVTVRADAAHAVQTTVDQFGRIDILVNNAGVNWRKPILDFEEDDWDKILRTNLFACHLCAKAVCPNMMKRGKGSIINIASMLASVVIPERGVYAASKAGLVQLTRYLAVELAEYGIRANAVCPGPFETEMVRKMMEKEGGYDYFLQRMPMKRIGQPAEIGGTVVYLASDASSFVTGTTIYIDGGWSAL